MNNIDWSIPLKIVKLEKKASGRYLKSYELTYLNKANKEKKYEIVSMQELEDINALGKEPSGVSIIATTEDKLLLLHEFRMGVNKMIYNLCAGMLEPDETIEECIERELYEETGLSIKRIIKLLPPSYAAVSITDTTTYIAFVEVTGEISDHSSDNEQIEAAFYSKDEIVKLLETEPFSSRAQLAAYFFAYVGLE